MGTALATPEQGRRAGAEEVCGEGTVLVVDDSPLARRVVSLSLRRAGYRVLEAADGEEALERYAECAAQVVITDISMPRLDGLQLLQRLRANELAPEVILLTASRAGDAEAAIQALRLGAHDYLAKEEAVGETLVLAVQRAAERNRLQTENAILAAELSRRSMTDSLTGVGNRRSFDAALAHEVARSRRTEAPLCLVLADIDHFKAINDHLGHVAGDEILSAFAARVSSTIRCSDRLYRYGGEEFAVLAPDVTLAGGLALAERIVAAVAVAPFEAFGTTIPVTCSGGAAVLSPEDEASGRTLVARADAGLYTAKRGGRNCARIDDGAGSPRRVRPVARAFEYF